MERCDFDDGTSALERFPSVDARPEGGNGLLPNNSIRGVDAARSSKVTIINYLSNEVPCETKLTAKARSARIMKCAGICFTATVLKYEPVFGSEVSAGKISLTLRRWDQDILMDQGRRSRVHGLLLLAQRYKVFE